MLSFDREFGDQPIGVFGQIPCHLDKGVILSKGTKVGHQTRGCKMRWRQNGDKKGLRNER